MKKRLLKKSEVLREGYIKGLKKAQSIIYRQLNEAPVIDAAAFEEVQNTRKVEIKKRIAEERAKKAAEKAAELEAQKAAKAEARAAAKKAREEERERNRPMNRFCATLHEKLKTSNDNTITKLWKEYEKNTFEKFVVKVLKNPVGHDIRVSRNVQNGVIKDSVNVDGCWFDLKMNGFNGYDPKSFNNSNEVQLTGRESIIIEYESSNFFLNAEGADYARCIKYFISFIRKVSEHYDIPVNFRIDNRNIHDFAEMVLNILDENDMWPTATLELRDKRIIENYIMICDFDDVVEYWNY